MSTVQTQGNSVQVAQLEALVSQIRHNSHVGVDAILHDEGEGSNSGGRKLRITSCNLKQASKGSGRRNLLIGLGGFGHSQRAWHAEIGSVEIAHTDDGRLMLAAEGSGTLELCASLI